jgi:lysozyme family protein
MSIFDDAFEYVCGNEGEYSNDAGDKGGRTWWGVTEGTARDHRCRIHPNGVLAQEFVAGKAKDLAKHIYRTDFWHFDGIKDSRLALKLFDITVNVGSPVRVIQRAAGVEVDGVYGEKTEAALTRVPTEQAIEALSMAVSDKYVDICLRDTSQLKFLKGWERRAIRRPPLVIKGAQ